MLLQLIYIDCFVRLLNVEKDPFPSHEDNEEVLGPEVSYLSAIGALMYLVNYTPSDISFATKFISKI